MLPRKSAVCVAPVPRKRAPLPPRTGCGEGQVLQSLEGKGTTHMMNPSNNTVATHPEEDISIAKTRHEAIKALWAYRTDYSEAGDFSQSVDAREWEQYQENVEVDALEAGMTEAEIESILYGDG